MQEVNGLEMTWAEWWAKADAIDFREFNEGRLAPDEEEEI